MHNFYLSKFHACSSCQSLMSKRNTTSIQWITELHALIGIYRYPQLTSNTWFEKQDKELILIYTKETRKGGAYMTLLGRGSARYTWPRNEPQSTWLRFDTHRRSFLFFFGGIPAIQLVEFRNRSLCARIFLLYCFSYYVALIEMSSTRFTKV